MTWLSSSRQSIARVTTSCGLTNPPAFSSWSRCRERLEGEEKESRLERSLRAASCGVQQRSRPILPQQTDKRTTGLGELGIKATCSSQVRPRQASGLRREDMPQRSSKRSRLIGREATSVNKVISLSGVSMFCTTCLSCRSLPHRQVSQHMES